MAKLVCSEIRGVTVSSGHGYPRITVYQQAESVVTSTDSNLAFRQTNPMVKADRCLHDLFGNCDVW